MARRRFSYGTGFLLFLTLLFQGCENLCFNDQTQHFLARYGFNQTITSPNYSSEYGSNHNCTWKITASGWNLIVRLYVVEFTLWEIDFRCPSNSLSIYDGGTPQYDLIAKLCGYRQPISYDSSGSDMFLTFKSDGKNTLKKFKLLYTAAERRTTSATTTTPWDTDPIPLFAYTYQIGYLQSADYSFLTYSYESMVWSIQTDYGYVVQLHVIDMNLEDSDHCFSSYVTVYDSDLRQLAKMCNYQYIGVNLYSRGQMYVHCTSRAPGSGRGFKLQYQAVWPSQADYEYTTRWATTTTTESPGAKNGKYAAMIGVIGGGVVIFLVFICCCLCCVCKKRKRQSCPSANQRQTRPSASRQTPSTSSLSPGSAMMPPNNSSVYVLPNSHHTPAYNSHVNMGFSLNSENPPAYFSLQHNADGFQQGAAAATYLDPNQLDIAPPSYSESMMMTHPPVKRVNGDTPGLSVEMGTDQLTNDVASALPAVPLNYTADTPLSSHPAPANGDQHGTSNLSSDDIGVVQPSTPAEPSLHNANPEIHV